MNVRSIRRITNDCNHNSLPGAQWFKGALYLSFRQGDGHVEPMGKIVVMRSRDEGVTFDTVAVLRGEFDTRDSHLYTDGKRLFLMGFEADANLFPHTGLSGEMFFSVVASTDNGLNWSQLSRTTGAENTILFHPEYFEGKHYCAGYTMMKDGVQQAAWSRVAWFESDDGMSWNLVRVLHEGEEQPNECSLAFHPDGSAVVLMRREFRSYKPLLLRAAPPYENWRQIELDVPLHGPCLWLVGDDVWFSGRWFLNPFAIHVAIFKVVDDLPVLQMVLPSGPGFDNSYMTVARHPQNQQRFFMAYYSDHTAPDGPIVSQWEHPDIYGADVSFGADFIRDWKVSPLHEGATLAEATCPQAGQSAGWNSLSSGLGEGHGLSALGFVDATVLIARRAGVIYFAADLELGPCDSGSLHLGYDGPIRVWLNGEQVIEASGSNPAVADASSVAVRFQHGTNRLVVALDTNGGVAEGIFARYEKT